MMEENAEEICKLSIQKLKQLKKQPNPSLRRTLLIFSVLRRLDYEVCEQDFDLEDEEVEVPGGDCVVITTPEEREGEEEVQSWEREDRDSAKKTGRREKSSCATLEPPQSETEPASDSATCNVH